MARSLERFKVKNKYNFNRPTSLNSSDIFFLVYDVFFCAKVVRDFIYSLYLSESITIESLLECLARFHVSGIPKLSSRGPYFMGEVRTRAVNMCLRF